MNTDEHLPYSGTTRGRIPGPDPSPPPRAILIKWAIEDNFFIYLI